ncbi:helix-turn-helix domain-containing protein [Paracoccus aestuariivivens]|uniref:Helix-turn-helix domain-containing protein n=1 Tax=Paracoccus aestuariivivens TaxID=1820333 RepID=A0A6L6JD07_9RHOB|nr:helix-turn-helix domain-containing protein [Paracoccus aestuariivivens]
MLTDVIKSLGLKRAVFADQLGIGRGYLSGLESGKKRPSLELAVRIERLTGGAVPVASWVDGSEANSPCQPAQEAPHLEIPHVQTPQ